MSIKPVFIISLPRSGSTLLQRLLAASGEIATRPEPWVALPLFYALQERGVSAIYGHDAMSRAVNGFIDELPNGRADYFENAGRFLQSLYALNSDQGASYFLDKTPRYYLIIDELMQAFPDGKFIFLWRNPLAVPASMIQTWGKGRWNLYMFLIDLYQGLNSLVDGYKKYQDRSIALRYEDLVASPAEALTPVMAYLEIDMPVNIAGVLQRTKKIESPGRGDPTGQYKYKGISSQSTESWKTVLANPYRKSWAKRYLLWIGQENLQVMGYDMDKLLSDVKEGRGFRFWLSDLVRVGYGKYLGRGSYADRNEGNRRYKGIPFIKT